ncbi:UNVERIFIED_CONTAM: copper amine oxidase-like protein [Acetivibrio alkalicellulosi]
MKCKKITVVMLFLFCIGLIMPGNVGAKLSEDVFITVKVNDNYIKMDVQPYIKDDRVFVTLRFVAEALRAQVDWDEEEKKVTVIYDDNEIEMFIDESTFFVNGNEKTMDTTISITDGRTMVPIRFITENFNCSVEWDQLTYTVIIEKEDIDISEDYIYERPYTDEDLMWLARIIHVEGKGLSINAKVAIANVVINRKESSRFPNTIHDVIFDKAYSVQFPPAHRQGFKELDPSECCIIAAKMSLEGVNNIEGALFFNNRPFTSSRVTLFEIIDGMYFYV